MQVPDMETMSIEVDSGIATVYFDRPEKLNAMNQTMFEELGIAADFVRDDPEVGGCIITGRGRAFCAGIDLSSMNELADLSPTEFRVLVRRMQRNFRAWELIEKPVIACVNGHALGAGTEIALACDMILAGEEATFGLLEVNIGLVTDLGATQRLTRFVGIHRAKELIMTGKKITAAEAMDIGLVNAVYPQGELREKTIELLRLILSRSPLAVGLCKIAIDRGRGSSIESGLEYEAQSQTIALMHLSEIMKKKSE